MIYDFIIIGSGFSGLTIFDHIQLKNKKILLISGKKRKHNYLFKDKQPGLFVNSNKGLMGGLKVWGKLCRPFDRNDFLTKKKYRKYKDKLPYALSLLSIKKYLPLFFLENNESNLLEESNKSNLFKFKLSKLKYFVFAKNNYFNQIIKNTPTFDNVSNLDQSLSKSILINYDVDYFEAVDDYYSIKLIGPKHKLLGKKIILAAGFHDSPMLLHKSISRGFKQIRHKAVLNIGKNLKDHIMGPAFIINNSSFKKDLLRSSNEDLKLGLSFDSLEIDKHVLYPMPCYFDKLNASNIKMLLFLFEIKKNPLFFFKQLAYFFNNIHLFVMILINVFFKRSNKVMIWSIFEQKKNKLNNIKFFTSSKVPEIHWNIKNGNSYKNINKIYKILRHLFGNNIQKINKSDFFDGFVSTAHQTGTLMQEKINNGGVVDTNYQIYGTKGIYCADASCIAESGHANTSLSIVINSLILTDYLNEN